MGKKHSAACRAAATAAPAPVLAPTASPAVPFDTHAALVDTPFASTMRESPTNTQHPRVSHEADATCVPHAASSAQPTVNATLVCEPASTDACTATSVAIATPPARAAHVLEPCPEQPDSPPALTKPISTSNDVSPSFHQLPPIGTHADTLTALRAPFPALYIPAVTDLTTAIDAAGPPSVFLACPTHLSCRAEDLSHELDTSVPLTCPATSIEEIDEDLLANIIEDAQSLTRIEAWHEVRLKALEEGHERGWKEGFEEGQKIARREVRAEAQKRERAWKDGYELGRWEGHREGIEVVRTEVSTPSGVDASIQTDISSHSHSPSLNTIPATSYVNTGVQSDAPPHPFPSRADSQPPNPTGASTTASRIDADVQTHDLTPTHAIPHVNADVQTDDPALDTPSTPTSACNTTPRFDPTTPRVDTGIQSDAPARVLAPTTRIHVGVQADAPAQPNSSHLDSRTPFVTGVHVHATPPHLMSPSSDNAHASVPARARTIHEIDHDLLRKIIATASARGEAAGMKKGEHSGFQEGMEAGRKSGTREGHTEGLREGREQYRLEASRTSRAVAAVQTDCSSLTPVPSIHDTHLVHTSSRITDTSHVPTTVSDNNSMSHNDHSLSHNDPDASFITAHTHFPSFSWAEEAASLPITSSAPLIVPPPHDFSVLRSSSARPFDSLKRHARRSQPRPTRPLCPPRPFVPTSEPIVTRRHPTGLRADRPSVIILSSPSVPSSVKLEAPPLDWQGDPHLQELGRVLRGLGWVHSSGS
ncbi:hypothetical protein EWM64_g1570 [Hericium alpestre]|uniref:Essential protein Yae1 N-terminal domain-containing protein n=1 Tax=Hericium alpestre TaxID=135208 RepID=A0A4Z0A607_9AGAM|nr:hypothetical protein EWM64_g1570 [Hericium alpestre]